MLRLLPFLAVAFFLIAGDARASCVPSDPRRQLGHADAAFVGRFESDRSEGLQRWVTFRVERTVKGSLSETVEIHEQGISSISLGSFTPGQRVGLMMNFADGRWRASQCQQADPEELLDAVKPLARPGGRGAGRFLVYGRFGDATAVALDARGRTVAYAFGGGSSGLRCDPSGRTLLELDGRRLFVRRMRDLKVVSSRPAASGLSAVHCAGGDVYELRRNTITRNGRRVWRGESTGLSFSGRSAYVARHHTILRVDLRTGRERELATLPLAAEHESVRTLAVSGSRLALLAPNHSVRSGEPPSKVAVLDVRTRKLRVSDLPAPDIDGSIVWAGDDRLAVLPYPDRFRGFAPARFFTAALVPLGEVPGFSVHGAIGGGGSVVGILGHRLMRLTPGEATELGRLPGSWVSGVVPLGGTQIAATPRVPRF